MINRIRQQSLVMCVSLFCAGSVAAQDWMLSPKVLDGLEAINASADKLAQTAQKRAQERVDKRFVIDHATEKEYLDLLEKLPWPDAKIMDESLDRIPDTALARLSVDGFARLMSMISHKDWNPEFYRIPDGAGHCRRAKAMIRLWDRLPDSYLKRLSIREIALVMRSLPSMWTSSPDAMAVFSVRTVSEDKLEKMSVAAAAELFRAHGSAGGFVAPPSGFWKGVSAKQLARLLDSFQDKPDILQEIMAAWTEANKHQR